MATTFDPQAIRAFEHAGWQRAAAHYAATFAQATCGFIDDLLDAACIGAGMRVLDLACGPGFASAAIAERGGAAGGARFLIGDGRIGARRPPGRSVRRG